MQYRQAVSTDFPAMARIRAAEWGEEDYWIWRINAYASGELNPQKALPPRILFVAVEDDEIAGFVAGHLTERYQCDGELEWINVIPAYRGRGIAQQLTRELAAWFVQRNARKVCVDVGSDAGRGLYTAMGAVNLNEHWMVWDDIGELVKNRNI